MKLKNAITRRNILFENWINNHSTENQKKYKTIRNEVSALIRKAKKEKIYRKIGKDPSAKCIYRTLKAIKCSQESIPLVIDPDIMNEFLVSIGPMLSSSCLSLCQYTHNESVENNVSITHRSMGSCKNHETNGNQETSWPGWN